MPASSIVHSVARGDVAHLPPEIAPSIFSVPRGHNLVNATGHRPVARGDLEQQLRLAVAMTCTAFGVPADLVLNARFSSRAQSEIAMLNNTIRGHVKILNEILTAAYATAYGEHDVTVELCVAPMSATDELVALYTSKLIPLKLAVERGLVNIGASRAQVMATLKQAEEGEERKQGKRMRG